MEIDNRLTQLDWKETVLIFGEGIILLVISSYSHTFTKLIILERHYGSESAELSSLYCTEYL